MTLLTALGLTLLKLSLNVTAPRQWTLQNSITDAYMTYEKAAAQRIPFADLTGPQSMWPADPSVSVSTVELGRLPDDVPIMGTVTRTRYPDANNSSTTNNPSGMEVWRFQSVIRYDLGGRTYLKSRTVVRSQ